MRWFAEFLRNFQFSRENFYVYLDADKWLFAARFKRIYLWVHFAGISTYCFTHEKVFIKLNIFYVDLSQLPFWPNNMAWFGIQVRNIKNCFTEPINRYLKIYWLQCCKTFLKKNFNKNKIFLILFQWFCVCQFKSMIS